MGPVEPAAQAAGVERGEVASGGNLTPGIASDVLSLSERLLPQTNGLDGSDGEKRRGADIARDEIPSWLAARDDEAALQNNEMPPQRGI